MTIPEITNEAIQAQLVVEDVLGDSIIGIYLFGSAVVGGLKHESDVDILVAVSRPPGLWQRKALVARLMGVSGAIGNSQAIRPLGFVRKVGSQATLYAGYAYHRSETAR